MDEETMIVDGHTCNAWRVSADRWHARAYTRDHTCCIGSGATAQEAAEDVVRHVRLLDEESPAALDAELARLRALLG